MKKILVTGSLGYIGSVLTPYLSTNNFECVGYDTGFFRDCIFYDSDQQETIIKDMRHFSRSDLNDVDVVVHLAGISNDPFGNLDPKSIYDPTREYSLKLAKFCKEMGKKFIFASSCSVYGKGNEGLLTEESETYPQTAYSLNKLQIEDDLRNICDESFTPIILRFATVFGLSPRMRFDIVINMLAGMAFTSKKIVLNSDGTAWRPNVHIKDVCKAIKYAIEYEPPLGKPLVLNVGDTSNNKRVIDIANIITKVVPESEIEFLNEDKERSSSEDYELVRDRKIQDGVDTRTYKISFEKIENVFKGFKCDWSIEDGIKDMVETFGDLKLTEDQFKNINFYRLQKCEHLFKNGLISDDMFWI